MYFSRETINEVCARMSAGVSKRNDLPVELRKEIRAYVESITPEQLRAAGARAWRRANGGA